MNVCLYLKPEIAVFVVVSILFQRDLKLWTKAITKMVISGLR